MTGSESNRKRGISIRVVNAAIILCIAIIAVLLIYSTSHTSSIFTTLSNETGSYIVRQKAAHDLMEASDYLTEMVQRFTLEGDTVYLDNYFEEAFATKRRETAILNMSEGDTDPILVQQLQEAMDESTSLMYREYYAMKLVIEAKEIREYPDTLRAIELTEEDEFLSPEEKMDLAQNMVIGPEYYSSKEIIRSKLKSDLELLDQEMSNTRQETSSQMLQDMNTERILVIILTLVLFLLIVLTIRLITIPLIRAYHCSTQGKPLPVEGAREFRQLAESYNVLAASQPAESDASQETETE